MGSVLTVNPSLEKVEVLVEVTAPMLSQSGLSAQHAGTELMMTCKCCRSQQQELGHVPRTQA